MKRLARSISAACIAIGAHGPSRDQSSAETTYRIVPNASQASYAVDEVFLRENNRLFTAVGVTRAVSGEITVDRADPSRTRVGEVVVDLRQLTSDDHRRDNALREKYLDTDRYPHARLTRATLQGMPATITDGSPFRHTIVGELTLHGVTRTTTWRGESILAGDTLRTVAKTQVKMSGFGIEVPHLLSLRAADNVAIELRIVAVAASATPVGSRQSRAEMRRPRVVISSEES